MSLEALVGMAATQERIEKAAAPYKKLSQLASVSEAIVDNCRKLKNLRVPDLFYRMDTYKLKNSWINNIYSIAANVARVEANWKKLIGTSPLVEMAKQYKPVIDMIAAQQAAIANNEFIHSMQAIVANAEKTRQYWQKVVDESPLVRIAREFKQPNNPKGFLNPSMLRSLEPDIVAELNIQTEQAAVLAENYGARDRVSQKDLEEFKEFITTSFSALATAFKKSQRSPMALIAFWSGIIGLLWGILYPLTQPDAATQKQVEALEQENRVSKSEVKELRQDVKEMRLIIDQCLINTIRDVSKPRYVRCKLFLRLKPRYNSLFIYNLQSDQEVNIITSNRKWVYITVLDDDNLPASGWMLKKYLR